MEQETKRCPFCGEEILAIAKKCKHCKEWLDEDYDDDEYEEENYEDEEDYEDEELEEVDDELEKYKDDKRYEIKYVEPEKDKGPSVITRFFSWMGSFLLVLSPIIILLAVAYYTMPPEEEQMEKAKEELRVLKRKEIKLRTGNKDRHTKSVGEKIMKDDELLDNLVSQEYKIDIDNYIFLSIINVQELDTKEKNLFGLAIFGKCFFREIRIQVVNI